MHGPTCIFRANLTPFSPQVTIMLISPDTPRWIVEADEILQYRVLARCRGSCTLKTMMLKAAGPCHSRHSHSVHQIH
jgi:hypothetical protein